MRLQANPPLGVCHAVSHGCGRILAASLVFGLEEKMLEVEVDEALGLCVRFSLRVDEFQLVAFGNDEVGVGFRAHADPVDACGDGEGAVGFYCDFEAAFLHSCDQGLVQLKKGFAAGADYIRFTAAGPEALHQVRALVLGVAPAVGAVGTDKIRVTKLTDGSVAVFFAAAPEVAAGEAQEHGGAAGLGTFALEGVEGFFYFIISFAGHRIRDWGAKLRYVLALTQVQGRLCA